MPDEIENQPPEPPAPAHPALEENQPGESGDPVGDDAGTPKPDAPESHNPEANGRPPETPAESLDRLLEEGKEAVLNTVKETATALLKNGRDTLKALLSTSGLSEKDKAAVAMVYADAERLALRNRTEQAAQMMRRALNFVRSDELIQKAQRIEAVEGYLRGVLRLLSSAGLGFFNGFGKAFLEDAADLAENAVDDIMGKAVVR